MAKSIEELEKEYQNRTSKNKSIEDLEKEYQDRISHNEIQSYQKPAVRFNANNKQSVSDQIRERNKQDRLDAIGLVNQKSARNGVTDEKRNEYSSNVLSEIPENSYSELAKAYKNGGYIGVRDMLKEDYGYDHDKATDISDRWSDFKKAAAEQEQLNNKKKASVSFEEKNNYYEQLSEEAKTIADEIRDSYNTTRGNAYTSNLSESIKMAKNMKALNKLGYDADLILDYIKHDEDIKTSEGFEKDAKNSSTASLIAKNAASVGATVFTPIDAMEQVKSTVTNTPYDTRRSTINNYKEAVRNETAQRIYNNFGDGLKGKAVNEIYQMGMSLLDNAAAIGAGIATGAGELVTLPVMAMNAATSAYNDAIDRGTGETKAAMTAFFYGTFEALFEKIPLDNLYKMAEPAAKNIIKNSTKDILKQISKENAKALGKQILEEGKEEVYTSIADTIADLVINRDLSSINQEIYDYRIQGLSETEATQKAMLNFAGSLVEDFIGGALMGGVFGSISLTASHLRTKNLIDNASKESMDQIYEIAKESPEGTAAKELADSVESMDDLSDKAKEEMIKSLVEENNKEAIEVITNELLENDVNLQEDETKTQENNNIIQENAENLQNDEGILQEDNNIIQDEAPAEEKTVSREKAVVDANSGETLRIKAVENVNGLKTVFKTQDGSKVKFSDLQFNDSKVAELYNQAISLPSKELANIALQNYNGQLNVEGYVRALKLAYESGQLSHKNNQTEEGFISNLKNASSVVTANNEVAIREAFKSGYTSVNVQPSVAKTYDVNRAKIENSADEILKSQGTLSKTIAATASAQDVTVEMTENIKNNRGEIVRKIAGSYNNGKSQLNKEASNLYATMVHELIGEKMKAEDPEGYKEVSKALLDYMIDTYGNEYVLNQLNEYSIGYKLAKESGEIIEVADEYINDCMAGLYMTPEGIRDFANDIERKNKSKAAQIFEFIKNLAEEIINEITNYLSENRVINIGVKDGLNIEKQKAQQIRDMISKKLDALENNQDEFENFNNEVTEAVNRYAGKSETKVNTDNDLLNRMLETSKEQIKKESQYDEEVAELELEGDEFALDDEEFKAKYGFEKFDSKKKRKYLKGIHLNYIYTNKFSVEVKDKLTLDFEKLEKMYGLDNNAKTNCNNIINWFNSKSPEERIKSPGYFLIGKSSEAFSKIGLPDVEFYMGKSKMQRILNDHPEMNEKILASLPYIMKEPLFITSSLSSPKTSIVAFTDIIAKDIEIDKSGNKVEVNKGVMVSIEIVNEKAEITDYYLTSAYGRNTKSIQYYFNKAIFYWVCPQKNKTTEMVSVLRLQLPSATLKSGLNRMLPKNMRSVKLTDENGNVGKKSFSVDVPVEETRDLIAVHNIHESDLIETLKLGGFPMPSIAIMKANNTSGNDQYGEISVIFDKNAIDPQNNSDNKVYSGDAWTPTFPGIDIELNYDKAWTVSGKISKLAKNIDVFKINTSRFDPGNLEDSINKSINGKTGEESLVEKYKNDYEMKQVYLAESNNQLTEIPEKVSVEKMKPYEVDISQFLIKELGEDFFSSEFFTKEWLNKNGEQLEDARRKYFKENNISDDEIDQIFASEKRLDKVKVARTAKQYMLHGDTKETKTEDYGRAHEIIDSRINEDDYIAWLKDLFSGLEGKKGIYNGKDYVTNNGRRSWKELHDDVTLQNIVKAMRRDAQKGKGIFGYSDVIGASTKEFSSIDDIKKSKEQISVLDEESYKKIKDDILSRFDEIAVAAVREDNKNEFGGLTNAKQILIDNIANSKTKSGLKTKLKNDSAFINYSDDLVNDLWDLIVDIQQMPTGYFEAKPQRAIAFDEVKSVIIPNNSSDELKTLLDNNNFNVLEYDPKVEGDRQEKVNTLNDARFSVEIDDLALFEEIIEENEQLNEANNIIKNTVKNAADLNIKPADIKKIASAIKAEYKTQTSIDDITDSLTSVFNYMKQDNVNYDALVQIMSEIAKPILENATVTTSTRSASWDKFREHLINTKFRLSPAQVREVISEYGSTENYRKKLFGVTTVSSDAAMSLDEMWSELVDASGNALPALVEDTNQPEILLQTINGLRPQSVTENAYGMNLEEASYDLALDIYRRFFEAQALSTKNQEIATAVGKVKAKQMEYRRKSVETYKKKLAEQRKLLEAEKQRNMKALAEELRSDDEALQNALKDNNEVAAAIIQDLKNKNNARIEQIRHQKNEEIAKIKAKNFDSRQAERDRRKNTVLKEQIRNQINSLNKMLKSPNVAGFVKPSMVKGTIEVLEAINIDTGKSQGLRDKLQKLSELYNQYKGDNTFDFDYDESTAAMIIELRNTFEDRNYTELSGKELSRVLELVTRLKKQIQNASKLINDEKYSKAADCALDVIREVNESKGSLDSKLSKEIDKFFSYQLNAYRWFRKTAGYKNGALMNIYNQLDKGQMKMIQMQKEINEMFAPLLEGKENQENVKRLTSIDEKDMVDIGLKIDGKAVKVTRGMMLSYLMHIQNEDNARHMVVGGFSVPDMKAYKDGKYADAFEKTNIGHFFTYDELKQAAENIKYNKKDAGLDDGVNVAIKTLQNKAKKLRKGLSEWELSYLETAEKLFHEYYGQKINEVSVETKGYALAQVKNYFPINTDKKLTRKDFTALKKDGSLEGMGFTKERVKASNPILLEDIAQVILRQTDNTSRYYGFSIPVRNVNMVMNMKFNNSTTPETAISSKWGKFNLDLFQAIMQDVQTGRGTDSKESKIFTALRGNFAAATLTANIGVAMKQAASYPTAAAVLGWKAIGKAFNDIPKGLTSKGIEELEAINPLLWYRSKGQSSADINYAKQSDIYKYLENNHPLAKAVSVDLIQNIDSATVRTLEYASKYYVDDNFTELEKGSEEYWNKVSEVFTKVIEETQPNYTVLQRPEVLKSTNDLARQLFMFKTQPLQNFGIIYDSLGEFNVIKKKYKKDSKEYKNAVDKVSKAVSSQIVAAAVFSLMTICSNVIYHKLWKYDQDDEKSAWLEALLAFLGGMASTLSGMILCGDWIYNSVSDLLFGTGNYGVEVSIVSNFNNIYNYINNYKTYGEKLIDAKTESEREKAIKKLLQNSEDVVVVLGQYFGVPVNNIKNSFVSPILYIKDIVNDVPIGSSQLAWDESTDTQYMKMFDALISENTERYNKLRAEYISSSTAENPEKNADKKMKDLLKEAYNKDELSADQVLNYLNIAGIEYDKDDIVKGWEYTKETGNSYTQYAPLKDAIDNSYSNNADRKLIKQEIDKLFEAGKTKSQIASTITNKYKAVYLENKSADLKNLLITCYMYCGYTRDEAVKKINEWE